MTAKQVTPNDDPALWGGHGAIASADDYAAKQKSARRLAGITDLEDDGV